MSKVSQSIHYTQIRPLIEYGEKAIIKQALKMSIIKENYSNGAPLFREARVRLWRTAIMKCFQRRRRTRSWGGPWGTLAVQFRVPEARPFQSALNAGLQSATGCRILQRKGIQRTGSGDANDRGRQQPTWVYQLNLSCRNSCSNVCLWSLQTYSVHVWRWRTTCHDVSTPCKRGTDSQNLCSGSKLQFGRIHICTVPKCSLGV